MQLLMEARSTGFHGARVSGVCELPDARELAAELGSFGRAISALHCLVISPGSRQEVLGTFWNGKQAWGEAALQYQE